MYYYYGYYDGEAPLRVDTYTPEAVYEYPNFILKGTLTNPLKYILNRFPDAEYPSQRGTYGADLPTQYPADGINYTMGGSYNISGIAGVKHFPIATKTPLVGFQGVYETKRIKGIKQINLNIQNTPASATMPFSGDRVASVAIEFNYDGTDYVGLQLLYETFNLKSIRLLKNDPQNYYTEITNPLEMVEKTIDFGISYQDMPDFMYNWIVNATTEIPREVNKFDIYLYQNRAEVNRVGKAPDWLDDVGVLHGVLRDECSLTAPTIIFEAQQVPVFNYVHIPIFGRYYFVLGIDSVSKNLWRMRLNCDVLETYKSRIWNLSAVIDRQEKLFNPMLNDIEMPANVNSQILFREFPNEPFNPSGDEILNFVLISVGEGNDFA